MPDPPFDTGAVNATVADVALATATAPIVGAPETDAGVEDPDAPEAMPVPTLLVAVTVKV
jgi:hypothetical protein